MSHNVVVRAACLVICVVVGLISSLSARAGIFGSGTNTFTIDVLTIGSASNAADTTGYGSVPYLYSIAHYEVPQNAIEKATASGMTNVAVGAWTGNQPAANMTWYESAAFVNWLNTSTGRQAAYNLTFSAGSWSMSLWSPADAWTAGGTNLYRNKNAYYFLPSENEWYKAAYYSGTGSTYFDYNGSNTAPTAVTSGTSAGTAVYASAAVPAAVNNAGGLSSYGIMAQGGNVWEWSETAVDRVNDVPSESRFVLGTAYNTGLVGMDTT